MLSQRIAHVLAEFARSGEGSCFDFAYVFLNGCRPSDTTTDPQHTWLASAPDDRRLQPGSVVRLGHPKNPQRFHYAIYVARGRYLSKWGNGPQAWIGVTNLKSMHRFFGTTTLHKIKALSIC